MPTIPILTYSLLQVKVTAKSFYKNPVITAGYVMINIMPTPKHFL